MISSADEQILANLEKIESDLAKVYNYLSNRAGFSNPVKKFWHTIMNEELTHASVFKEIRDKAKSIDSFEVQTDIDLGELRVFVEKVNQLLKEIKDERLTESEAYSVAAVIEAALDEAKFLRKIKTNDNAIEGKIKQIINETKKHNIILVNYSRGIQ